ncbi:FAD dependent oxidoreductase-domain-containing protein [Naematelia encephala]|uniref:FAD dependent oxidoreductase-domain-containing protein n=1 Tax=Naematelia encephala TaxID=71784 RepID=A0A1Y2B052_9TREE|nr:FAD dependent oxidoreductase-domain-containing protein [Naematelia encephala]
MPIATPKVSPWGKEVLPPTWSLSAWQRSTREDPLVNRGRDEALPEFADVVIIGSGLSGAAVGYNLLTASNRPASVVCLEARECTSGASGRNAGHCRPDTFRGFKEYADLHGEEQSAMILASESITWRRMDAFIKEYAIDCEWTPRLTVDVAVGQEFKNYMEESIAQAKRADAIKEDWMYLDPAATQQRTSLPSTLGSYGWQAATLNPAKLTYGVHRVNLTLGGYQLFTHAPVTSVDEAVRGEWLVQTTRGALRAAKVVFATNGYTKLILPELAGLITPLAVQALQVGEHEPKLESSMSLRYGDRRYSVAQRPNGKVVLSNTMTWVGQTEAEWQSLYENMDDSTPIEAATKDTMDEWLKHVPDADPNGFEFAWRGILGMTPDRAPWVGAIPGKEGQYIIAGMNGHGMARIFHCAPCAASLVLGGQWDETLPKAFECSQERIDTVRQKVKEGLLGYQKP